MPKTSRYPKMHHHILAGELGMRPRAPRGEPRGSTPGGVPLITPGAFPFGTWGRDAHHFGNWVPHMAVPGSYRLGTGYRFMHGRPGENSIWGTEQYDYSAVLARPVHSSTYVDVDVSRWLIGRPIVDEFGQSMIKLRAISIQFWLRLRSWLRRARGRVAGLYPGTGETQRGILLRLGARGAIA